MNANPSPQPEAILELPDGESRWRRRQILDASVLAPLTDLNREFIDLLHDAPRRWNGAAGNGRLPDPVHLTLASLDARHRELLASCPFSLFGARFRDDGLWNRLAHGREPLGCSEDWLADVLARKRAFAQSALFFVWHLVHANQPAARLVFAISEGTLDALRVMNLVRVQQIAHAMPHLFTPRWSRRPAFWSALIEELERGGAFPSRAHLLGVQMLAAEKADVRGGEL